eukprot:Nk52_evm29s352 gene=Nk52_evmTU29s352
MSTGRKKTVDYRQFDPINPCSNRLLAKKWDDFCREKHQCRIQNIKSAIDTEKPNEYVHLRIKLKQIKIEEENRARIDRENKLLLAKMAYIMRQKPNFTTADSKRQRQENINRRRREQKINQINTENKFMLNRLKNIKPIINTQKLLEERKCNETYLTNICRYPLLQKLPPIDDQGNRVEGTKGKEEVPEEEK